MVIIDFANLKDIQFLKENTKLSDSQLNHKINHNQIIIACRNNNQVGWLILDYLWGHIPFISFINVLKGERQRGVGKELLKFIELYLIGKGEAVLFSSSMENEVDAQSWHRKMGFVETGLINNINDNNIGEIFYRKELKPE